MGQAPRWSKQVGEMGEERTSMRGIMVMMWEAGGAGLSGGQGGILQAYSTHILLGSGAGSLWI